MKNKKDKNKKSKEKIIDTPIYDELIKGYLPYAAANVMRMLPNVIDGLKETQRKILYIMYKNRIFNLTKCNKIIGDVTPYVDTGDSGIYGALVRMGQYERYKHTLITPQGNFGYINNGLDEFADQRYTEASLSEFTRDFYFPEDIEAAIMDSNYSGDLFFPRALPTLIPMGLVLGGTGVCPGYKYDCPPHSLEGVAEAYIKYIENLNSLVIDGKLNEKYIEKLVKVDFPNKSKITKTSPKGLLTGKGQVSVEGLYKIEEYSYGRLKLSITELPYLVSTPSFCNHLKNFHTTKELFSEMHDYSGKEGILIELISRKDVTRDQIVDYLYATNFSARFNYSLIFNDERLAKRLNIFEVFQRHYDYKTYCIVTHYKAKKGTLERRKINMEALKYILEDKSRRDQFFEILKKSDKETIYLNMYKKFGKSIKNLDNEAIDYITNGRFNLFMNKAETINNELKKIYEDLKNTNWIIEHPDRFLINEIRDKIKKYK